MMEKIRLCYIGDGRSVHIQRWVKHFSDLGYDVHLISDWKAPSIKATVHLIEGAGAISFIKKIFITRRLIKKIHPDIVHAHFAFGYGLFGAMSGHHPFFISPWGSDITRIPEESRIYKTLVKYALRKADIIQCGDEYTIERVIELTNERDNIRLIGWGIDLDLFKPEKNTKDGKIRILYLRKAMKIYGIDVLLNAIPNVVKIHENVKFLILNSGSEIERTRKIIHELGVEKHVELIEERPNQEMPTIFNSCDIYVDTVYNEIPGCGIGITALEAMGCGVPVIVPNTKGAEFYIEHKKSGFIYKGNDSDSLGSGLVELIENESLRNEIGLAGRKSILSSQDWQKNMQIMDSLYKEMIGKGDAK
jgi:glycosyltransferase involved in cell wall biosynthesis